VRAGRRFHALEPHQNSQEVHPRRNQAVSADWL
jgi:hypothetical protein